MGEKLKIELGFEELEKLAGQESRNGLICSPEDLAASLASIGATLREGAPPPDAAQDDPPESVQIDPLADPRRRTRIVELLSGLKPL